MDLGQNDPNYMKLINIHDVEVSISAWVSHVMPLNITLFGMRLFGYKPKDQPLSKLMGITSDCDL